MGMMIENEFTVPAAPDKVMAYLLDVDKVAKCLPGAQLTHPRRQIERGGGERDLAVFRVRELVGHLSVALVSRRSRCK